MAAVIIFSDFGAPKDKVCHCFRCFPIYLPWSDGTGCHVFWMLFLFCFSILWHSAFFIVQLSHPYMTPGKTIALTRQTFVGKVMLKILQEMRVPDYLTCLLRNLCAGQETTVRTGHETMDWFQVGKGVRQGCILSPCLFNFYAEYIMQNARLDEAQTGIKIAGWSINNLRYADDTTLMAESERN